MWGHGTSLIIQIVIAGFLIWYANETHKLRKEATYQRDILVQPLIDFIYNSKDPPNVWVLENAGSGAAINLHLYVWLSQDSKMIGLPEDVRPSIIKPNNKLKLGPLKERDTSAIIKMHPKIDSIIRAMTHERGLGALVAIYEDVAGNAYYSKQNGIGSANPLIFRKL